MALDKVLPSYGNVVTISGLQVSLTRILDHEAAYMLTHVALRPNSLLR